MKKILTIEQLVNFCEQKNFHSFSSKDTGYQLCVQMPATFEKESEDDSLLFVKVKVFHTGRNRNKSNVTVEAAKRAMKGMAYKPILAHIIEVDGVKDFSSHDGYIDDDGNWVYEEKQIGCFTSDKPYMEQDEENEDRNYVYAYAAIPREYTDAADIIERKNGTKVSVELMVNEMSFDVENKELILDDVAVMGCTCLGIDEFGNEIGEGMEGARMDIEDFSVVNNSICNHFDMNVDLIDKINDLNEALSNLNIDIFKKEVNNEMSFMEQLLEKYGVTLEDIDFEFETMSDEELEQAFMNKFETSDDNSSKEEFDDPEPSDPNEPVEPAEPEVTDPTDDDSDEDEADEYTGHDEVTPKKYAIEMSDGTVKEFAVSLNDKIYALETLVNEMYSEADNDYYCTIVYDKEVVMVSYWTGKAYRQSYKERKGVYSLQGDRVSVHAIYVTDDEEAELDRIKSNYSVIENELSTYKVAEEKANKEALMVSEDYSSISSTEEFSKIDIENYTFAELKDELDGILLSYAKAGKLNFAKQEEKADKKTQFKPLPFNEKKTKKKGRYGSLFSKK